MTITTAPPSPQAQAVLKALQTAVTNNLEKKRKLGQYAVIWRNGRPEKTLSEVPETKA